MRERDETQIAFDRSMRAEREFLREMLKSLREAEWQFKKSKLLVAESKQLLVRLSSLSPTLDPDAVSRSARSDAPGCAVPVAAQQNLPQEEPSSPRCKRRH